MKLTFTLSFLLGISTCFAQKQNVYYLKNNGSYVSTKDSADYMRVVREPDAGSDLYNVFEFYNNGEKKLIGKSSKVSPVVFQGQIVSYFPNGKKMQLANYHNNNLTGLFYQYFPSGKILSVVQYRERTDGTKGDYLIISCLDTAGNMLVKEGNGHYIGYDNGAGSVVEEGDVKNGQRVGDWKGSVAKIGIKFEEHYEMGKLTSGTAIDKAGNKHIYAQRNCRPYYRDGNKAFYKFITNQINYLGKGDIVNVNGTAVISFVIDANRNIEDIKILNSSSESINKYIAQATAMSAKGWVPATLFGIPQKESYTLPYSLKSEDSIAFY